MTRRILNPLVLGGMASVPEREASLERAIESLAPQVDMLEVSLNGYTKVPAFFGRYENVVPTIRPKNGGDAEKFAAVDGWDGYIVTCDDDLLYPHDYVDTLLAGLDRHGPDCLVSFHGGTTNGWSAKHHGAASVKRIRCLGDLAEDDPEVNVLGTGTLAWHAAHVPIWRDIFRTPNMADVYLATHARTFGIPMVALAHEAGWLEDICPEGVAQIYESNRRGDGSRLDTRRTRKAELQRVEWTADAPMRPLVRVSIATCDRPHLLTALLEDLEREAAWVNLEVCVYEDPTDADYTEAHAIVERNGWEWTRFEMRLGRLGHWQLVDQELADCRFSRAEWFVFLPDDIRLVRHTIPRAITTWQRIDEPATLTLWRLKDHEGQTNWTGRLPVDRGEAWEIFHVDGIYLCRRETLKFFQYSCPRPSVRRTRSTSSGVGRGMSLALHLAGKRMYRVSKSLAIPLTPDVAPSVMNPYAGDRVHAGVCL